MGRYDSGTIHGVWQRGPQIFNHITENTGGSAKKLGTLTTISLCFFMILLVGAIFCWVDVSVITGSLNRNLFATKVIHYQTAPANCSEKELAATCDANYLTEPKTSEIPSGECPEYFRWIHEDLWAWRTSGISREVLESVKELAHFRLVILKGKVYVEKYKKAFQTRDLFTIWGILQLLRLYPGKIPDLEMMFYCEDKPLILRTDYQGPNATLPPVVFHYCGHENSLDVVFPDWTFWGWAETNIKPWASIMKSIREGNNRTKWIDRAPYAYWKGNPDVSQSRADLLKCNSSEDIDWKVRLQIQDWDKEREEGFKNSSLEDQCTHRYKIYVEGVAWSVSEKYILACDSMTLFVEPEYHDFFVRSMVPMKHYWPIRASQKCRDIKFAVEWGNNHTRRAQAIGKAGSRFIHKQLKMKYVYDYMFHLLNGYAKLQRFEPQIPENAEELCPEKMVCNEDGLWKKFMMESTVNATSETLPCEMPPPYDAPTLQVVYERKEKIKRQVANWEKQYWLNTITAIKKKKKKQQQRQQQTAAVAATTTAAKGGSTRTTGAGHRRYRDIIHF